jgi:hypothetical protein
LAITDGALIFFRDHDFLHEDGPVAVTAPRAEFVALPA